MSLIPLLFFWVIGAAMHHSQGHYMESAGRYTILFGVTVLVAMNRGRFRQIPQKLWIFSLSACAALFASALLRDPLIIYANPASKWIPVLTALDSVALAATGVLCIVSLAGLASKDLLKGRPAMGRAFKWAAILAFFSLTAGELLVPLISPHPWIDVWVNNTRAVDFFLHGSNPYTQIYPDIYHGFYDYKPGFLYFPGLLYWLAPFRAVFGDIRYGYVFANLLIAGGLAGIGKKLKAPEPVLWLAPLLWLSFPVTYFVLEQSWIDTVLLALGVAVFWSLEGKKWLLTGALMGAAFSVKQYGFLIGAIATLQIWRQAGWKAAARAVAAGALVAGVIVVPFAIADWKHFYASTITAQTASAVRLDAYNATSYLAARFHWLLPTAAQMAFSILGIAAGGLYVARKRFPGIADSAIALFLGYGAAFLFGKFAFCNYHYLLAGFLLLYLVAFSAGRSPKIGAFQRPQRARR